MCAKHFGCFLGCTGGANIALVTISISPAPFLVSRCFLWDICFTRSQSGARAQAGRLKPIANGSERFPTQGRDDVVVEDFHQPYYRDLVSTRCGAVERDLRANAQLAVLAQVRDAGRQPKVGLGG